MYRLTCSGIVTLRPHSAHIPHLHSIYLSSHSLPIGIDTLLQYSYCRSAATIKPHTDSP